MWSAAWSCGVLVCDGFRRCRFSHPLVSLVLRQTSARRLLFTFQQLSVWLVAAGVSLHNGVFVCKWNSVSSHLSSLCVCIFQISGFIYFLIWMYISLCNHFSLSFPHFLCPVISYCSSVATTSSAGPVLRASHNQILNKSGKREWAYVTEKGRRVPVPLSSSEGEDS